MTVDVVRRPGATERNAGRSARQRRAGRAALGLTAPVVLVALWQLAASQGWIDQRLFGSPREVWSEGVDQLRDGDIVSEIAVTVRRLTIGYGLGAAVGVLVGLVLGQIHLLRALFQPLLQALYVVPKLAVLPILLILFGLGETPKVLFVAAGVFFVVMFSTLSAVELMPPTFYEVARSVGASRRRTFVTVTLPGSMPQVRAGLRLAAGIGLLLEVAVEFLQANEGIGYFTWHAWELFFANRMYLGIVVISLIGVGFTAFVSLAFALLVPASKIRNE